MPFGFTGTSALSVGVDPARADLTPQDLGTGAVISVGTIGAGIRRIVSDSQTVTFGTAPASGTTTATSTITGAELNDTVVANAASTWSGNDLLCPVIGQVTAADTVSLTASNVSGNAIALSAVAWRITSIAY